MDPPESTLISSSSSKLRWMMTPSCKPIGEVVAQLQNVSRLLPIEMDDLLDELYSFSELSSEKTGAFRFQD